MADRVVDWNGIERRQHYCMIGADRFANLERKVDEMHPKVMNGLSAVPGLLKWGFGIVVTILLALAATLGTIHYKLGQVDQKVVDHIQWGEARDAENQDRFDEIEGLRLRTPE